MILPGNFFAALPCIAAAALAFPASASAEVFNGPYAGAEAGIGVVKTKGSTFAGPFKDSDSSVITGAVIGYRLPLGDDSPIVLGAEGNAGIYADGTDARYGISGIGGVRIGEKALVYLRGGYGWLDGVQTGAGKGVDGAVIGGGAEFGITDAISIRADYKYLDYGGVDFPDNTLDFKGHEITAGLLFNF